MNKAPCPPADPDAIIIGAGISGMYQLIRLRELGMKLRVFEAGSDIGGTWYWNRYPGARFDSESWSYGYSFSEELLQEWEWPEHFAAQPDTLRYLNFVANKFDLRKHITFNSRVNAAHFDDAQNIWTVTLESGETCRAPLLITGLGPLSAPTLPNIPGRDSFQGQAFHTARWPHDPVDFTGKRVGIIGTGATAIQIIQTIAKDVGHLTVFQRTPNWAAPLHNRKITPEEQANIKASYPEIFARCRETATCFIHQTDPRKALEVSTEEREAFWEKLYAEPGFGIWVGNFADVLTNKDANALASDFMARKIRQRVKDPAVAEKLIPKNHGFGTRRLPLESGYYEVYNQPNVRLVDINETPIESITPDGIRTSAEDFAFDILIFSTGFDGVTGPYDRMDIRGPGGRSLKQEWIGTPKTFLGVMAEGFPNMLMVLGPHTARGNIPRNIEEIVDWVTGLVTHMRQNGLKRVEPKPEAVHWWAEKVEEAVAGLLFAEVNSWQTGVNRNVEGRDIRRTLGYYGGAVEYRRMADEVASGGYREFNFTCDTEKKGRKEQMKSENTLSRRSLLALGAGIAAYTPSVTRAQEANWPNRPVRIIAAFPAGSGTDSLARFYGERLGRIFGQNFIIENIGGANGAIGARAAARAAPDGYTIFFGSVSTHAANPNLMREPGYDPLRDFAPLSLISTNPLGVLVRADFPARDLQGFIAHARANPGALNYGIGNAGGLAGTHLLSQAAGFRAEQIAYRGTPQAMADLLGGRLHFLVTDLGPAVEHLRAGTIRALAVTTARRVETLPDVPTVAESGLPGFDFASWNGSWMPARTPPAIIARLNREMVAIGQSEEAKRHIGALGIVSTTSTPEELGAFNRRELELWARIAAEANVAKE